MEDVHFKTFLIQLSDSGVVVNVLSNLLSNVKITNIHYTKHILFQLVVISRRRPYTQLTPHVASLHYQKNWV